MIGWMDRGIIGLMDRGMIGWMDTLSSIMHYLLSLPIICRRQLTDGTIYFLENNPSWISAVVGDNL